MHPHPHHLNSIIFILCFACVDVFVKVLDPLELELQADVSPHAEIEPRPSGRAASGFSHLGVVLMTSASE